MALKIDHPEVDELARELAIYTGETIPQAVVSALRERLAQEKQKRKTAVAPLKEALLQIGKECAALPLLDSRSVDEILGYNKQGVPT